MPGVVSSHSTYVAFDGVEIGYLTGFDIDAKAGQLIDSTNVNSQVIGEGWNSRVVRWYDCSSIEPPSVSITFFGTPSFTPYDCGRKGWLEFNNQGNSMSGEAILMAWNYSGRPNQYTTGTATFQLTGAIA